MHPSRRSKPELRRWFSEAGDIRADKTIRAEILVYLKQHSVHSVAVADRIIGCPHEGGIDAIGLESFQLRANLFGREAASRLISVLEWVSDG